MNPTARLLLTTRGFRAFGDGFIALILPIYLIALGLSPFQVGLITTATLLGSAVLTLGVGFLSHRFAARTLLITASLLMLATGIFFSQVREFWPLMVIGFVGTLNPSGGDVSPFLPLEQSMLSHAGPDNERTRRFARFGLTGSLAVAAGSLAVGVADRVGLAMGSTTLDVARILFMMYGLIGLIVLALYRRLPKQQSEAEVARTPLGPSRNRVLMLAGLFSIDSFGGGFVVQSLLALWLFQTWGLSIATASAFFTNPRLLEWLYGDAAKGMPATPSDPATAEQVTAEDETIRVHRGLGPDDILLCVGGGEAGGHSAFFPSWSRGRSVPFVTKEVPA